VTEALGKQSPNHADSQTDIRNLIDRVVIDRATIRIHLSEVAEENGSARILTLSWTRPSPYRKREIIQGTDDAKTYARPMPANARSILTDALRDAHRWLHELLSDSGLTLESLASREGKTVRWIRMTLSLAFLAPEIVRAAIEGRLPRGFGLKRLVDLPMAWPDQWRTLGLQTPQRTRDEPVGRSSRRQSRDACRAALVSSVSSSCRGPARTSGALGLRAPIRTLDEPDANSNSGNGNMRLETFGRSRRQWGAETAGKTQQTD
jgi:hypothetical protein